MSPAFLPLHYVSRTARERFAHAWALVRWPLRIGVDCRTGAEVTEKASGVLSSPTVTKRQRSRHRAVLLCMVVLVTACVGDQPPVSGMIDDLGRAVTIVQAPQRIVSLSPALTEILFDVGAGGRLVGRTQWDVYPPEALGITNVGEGMPPNVEAVAGENPDLVIFYASEVNRAPMEQLAAVGIPSFSVKIDLLERLPEIYRMIGRLISARERADNIAAAFQERLDAAASAQTPLADTVGVIVLTWDNPPIVIGGRSFLSELIRLAGAENVFADVDAPSASVSIETIAARDPDVFLVTTGGELPSYVERPEWSVLRAVNERRFAFVEGTEFEWPSTRSLEALGRLREGIRAAARRQAGETR